MGRWGDGENDCNVSVLPLLVFFESMNSEIEPNEKRELNSGQFLTYRIKLVSVAAHTTGPSAARLTPPTVEQRFFLAES